MQKHVTALLSLLVLMLCSSCGVDFKAQRPTIQWTYNDYLSYEHDFRRYENDFYYRYGNSVYDGKYIMEKEEDERKDITHIAVKSANDETVLLNFDVAAKSYDNKKYRYFGEDNNKHLFLDIWESKQGYTNMIDGHIDSYIIYFNGDDITYEKTPDNAVPLLIKDGWLYAYSKLQFLKIDMETGQQEVLY